MMSRPPTKKRPASKAIIAGVLKAEWAPCAVGERDGQQHQASGGEAETGPLTQPDLEAEDAVGHDGEQDDATGEHGLDDRHRRHRERSDVEAPGGVAIACRSRTTSSGTASSRSAADA